MKFPQTLLVRTFLLMVALIALSLSASLAIFHYVQQEPRANQLAQQVVTVVNLTRAAMLSAAPEWRSALFEELSNAEGLRVTMAEENEKLELLSDNRPEMRLMMKKVRASLGEETHFALERNQIHALWVSFYIGHEAFWIAVPNQRIERSFSQVFLIKGGIVFILALLGAYLIAWQVAHPLHRVALAVQQLGQGTIPPTLPEQGAQEIAAVSRAFNKMSQDLAANERERALVLAGISHDLRTPLTRVRLAAEMSNDAMLRDGLIADVAQMDEVIQQFLDYARLDESEVLVQTDVSQLVEECAQHFKRLAPSLTLDVPAAVSGLVRPLLLKRAVCNLLDNAAKYGGGDICVRLQQQGDKLLIAVADNGTGIPLEQRELALRPFIRLQSARSDSTGAGLGLAIVERAAKLHGGELLLGESDMGGLLATLVL